MPEKCKITIHDSSIFVSPKKPFTSKKIRGILLYTLIINKWGKENFFNLNIYCSFESFVKSSVELRHTVFWLDGKCIAIEYSPA